jgi:CubicO group peptidase (beta-lactamase class C family)
VLSFVGMRIPRLALLAVTLVAGVVFLLPWVGRADSFSAIRFEQYLESLRLQAGIPGLSAVIVQNGTIAWERGFGQADVERNIPALPDTPYPIAGVTSSMSAVQVLQCVERGQLALDTLVLEFYPGFDEPQSVLKDLMAHLTPPGRFVYDPDRYGAVANGIKVCTGKTLRASFSDALLGFLGLTDSVPGHDFATWSPATVAQFPPETIARYSAIMARMAKSYRGVPRGKPAPTTFTPAAGLTGSDGMVSSARDLGRFQAAIDTGVLLQGETIAAAWTPMVQIDGRPSPHGLGWFVQSYDGQPVVWQFGVIPDAYSSLMITLPRRGVTLVLLANSDGLVEPFQLANGDISASPFARFFINLFS